MKAVRFTNHILGLLLLLICTSCTMDSSVDHLGAVEELPVITFQAGTQNSNETVGSSNIIVVLSNASTQAVTVNYTASDVTAVGGGTDYTLTSGTLTFAVGSVSQTISATFINSATFEVSETFDIILSQYRRHLQIRPYFIGQLQPTRTQV